MLFSSYLRAETVKLPNAAQRDICDLLGSITVTGLIHIYIDVQVYLRE